MRAQNHPKLIKINGRKHLQISTVIWPPSHDCLMLHLSLTNPKKVHLACADPLSMELRMWSEMENMECVSPCGIPKMTNFTRENDDETLDGMGYYSRVETVLIGSFPAVSGCDFWNWDCSSGHLEPNPWSKASPAGDTKSLKSSRFLDDYRG